MTRIRQKFFVDLACEVGVSKGMAAQLPATPIEPSVMYEAIAGRGDVRAVARQVRGLSLSQFEQALITLTAYVNETYQRNKEIESVRQTVVKWLFSGEAK